MKVHISNTDNIIKFWGMCIRSILAIIEGVINLIILHRVELGFLNKQLMQLQESAKIRFLLIKLVALFQFRSEKFCL